MSNDPETENTESIEDRLWSDIDTNTQSPTRKIEKDSSPAVKSKHDSPSIDSEPNDSTADTRKKVEQAAREGAALSEVVNIQQATKAASQLSSVLNERTVSVNPDVDEDAFFSTTEGNTTITNRYDLEKSVPLHKKAHFREINRYWVNKPYSFVILFKSTKENEIKYYAIEPHQSDVESDLQEYIEGKLQQEIKYGQYTGKETTRKHKLKNITTETHKLLNRFGLYTSSSTDEQAITPDPSGDEEAESASSTKINQYVDSIKDALTNFDIGELQSITSDNSTENLSPTANPDDPPTDHVQGIKATPTTDESLEEAQTLTQYQVEKLLYYLQRDYIGYEKIDPIKHDVNIEDISCDGYHSPVFVYHTEHEQIISNIFHQEEELDDFVVKLAQLSGKGISKRQPQVDATLPDGSRAQLTLGTEVSDHGTNYTIRQFKEVPFTPVDLVNWGTFSLDQMALLWLAIENEKSLIFAGGTASGKTTSLNAVSLFIPSNTKIVSIEDTREVELPQRNWVASVTRPSFTEDEQGDIDEFDLLEAALRQRPDYIVMGEIRGEEGRTLFQVMSTGHTTYTTFHADSVGEVIKRFTTDPINVSKTMFTALDLVSIQTATRVDGQKVRRNKVITEINSYSSDDDDINVQDVYRWAAEGDQFDQIGNPNILKEIKFDRGWQQHQLERELFERKVVLAYLIKEGLNTYTEVAATIQAYINDPETILSLIADSSLKDDLDNLREMESVEIDIDEEIEALVPRPDPDEEQLNEVNEILNRAEKEPLPKFKNATDFDGEIKTLFDKYTEYSAAGIDESLTAFIGDEET